MQLSRLFEIVYILLNRGHITAKELAARFEVSIRTIYRDIDALSAAGVPVYATQGAGGGIHISESYVLNKSTLTDTEQAQILLALKSLSAAEELETSGLLSKLGHLFGKDTEDWIEIDFSRWGGGAQDRQAIALIKDATLGRRIMQFTYYSAYGQKSARRVCPVKMVYKARAWYLQAYDCGRKAYRTFKICRMADICLTQELFTRALLPPLPAIEAVTGPPMPSVRTTLRFQPYFAWRVFDEFNPKNAEPQEDGAILVRACLPLDQWLVGYLLSFGEALEVIEPAELREALAAACEKIRSQYKEI